MLENLEKKSMYMSLVIWFYGIKIIPDSKVHGVNMGPIWGRQDPGGPHVGPMNFAIWDIWKGIRSNSMLKSNLFKYPNNLVVNFL